jgi:hypothetical protein
MIEGSIVDADGWKGCNSIKYHYEHYTVNRGENYTGRTTGATHAMEGTWNGVKHLIPLRNRNVKIRT